MSGESIRPNDDRLLMTAYSLGNIHMPIIPANVKRDWMEKSFANRCLPLLIANQAGWFILNNVAISVIWDGGDATRGLRISSEGGVSPPMIKSHFGFGILTWTIPYLFRTPPGFNLHVRGPANVIKDGIQALEGIVETDWAVATFTVNWKVTRPNHPITFAEGEPICMILPQRRGELESFSGTIKEISKNPGLRESHGEWKRSRKEFIYYQNRQGDSTNWQMDYTRGTSPNGTAAAEHQVKLVLEPFIFAD